MLVALPRRQSFQERRAAKLREHRRGLTQEPPADRTPAREPQLDACHMLGVGKILRSEDLHRL
jgi:hypothetical protein